jgi:hypothetical protein
LDANIALHQTPTKYRARRRALRNQEKCAPGPYRNAAKNR